MRYWVPLVLVVGAAVALTGCSKYREGPHPAVSVPEVALEERETVVILNDILRKKIAIEAQGNRWTDTRRLQVFANIRNRTDFVQNIDVQTVFKDEAGFSLRDETAWQRIILEPNETTNYTSTSLDDRARKYTIRIREGH
jgi:uncharacterized protein YcfL